MRDNQDDNVNAIFELAAGTAVVVDRRPGKLFEEIREAVSDRGGGVRGRGEAAHKGRRAK